MNIYDKITKPYEEVAMKTLKEFVAIDSVYDEKSADKENPFGKGVSNALKYIAEVARKDGFKVTNYDNMVIEIIIGEGPQNITIMAHADVVPTGNGWKTNPFEVVEKDGVLYGRGVADDKGPLVACYYGLKALKDNNMLGKYQVRFLVGGNEESGSLCMEHYFKTLKKPQPTFGFSPDSDYPLIFAEKAIMGFEVKKSIDLPEVISLHGGVAHNAVIEECEVLLKDAKGFVEYLKKEGIKFEANGNTVKFLGKAAHGALPELGINAGIIALIALATYFKNDELLTLANKYTDLQGKGINADGDSPDMGHNSVNVGIMDIKDGKFSMIVNFRFVDTCDADTLVKNIKEANKPFETEIGGTSPLLFFPRDSVLVSTLLRVYQEEYNDYETKPLAIGGGTYAKEADNTVAFGMQLPDWDAKMHSNEEQLRKVDLFKGMAVYAHAIIELGKKL